ncbi:hypothetical protein ABK040_003997 [Willaertia magna]
MGLLSFLHLTNNSKSHHTNNNNSFASTTANVGTTTTSGNKEQKTTIENDHHNHSHHHHQKHDKKEKVSIKQFANQYLELIEKQKRQQLSAFTSTNNNNANSPTSSSGTTTIINNPILVAAKINEENNGKNNVKIDLSTSIPIVDLEGNVVSPNTINAISDSVTYNNTARDDTSSNNNTITMKDNGNTTTEESTMGTIQKNEEENKEGTENATITKTLSAPTLKKRFSAYKTFLVEHAQFINSLDEIFRVTILGDVKRLRILLSEHRGKTGTDFSLGMANLRFRSSSKSGKANHNHSFCNHCTLLHAAARFNHVEILTMLLTEFRGTNESVYSLLNIEDDIHATPIFYSVTSGAKEATAYLCSFTGENGTKINIRDKFGNSPLWFALNQNNFAMADVLIMFGGDVFFKIHGGETYLHRACEIGDVEIVKYLIEGSYNRSDNENKIEDNTNSYTELSSSTTEERRNLILRVDQKNQTPLYNAVRSYYIKSNNNHSSNQNILEQQQQFFGEQALDYLLSHFQKSNPILLQKALAHTDQYGHSVIHHCCECDHFQALLKLTQYYENDEKLVTALNAKDKVLGSTPLHISIMTGHFDIFNLLINCKEIEVNLPNSQNDLPLHIALRQKKLNMVQLLYPYYTTKDLDFKNNQSFSCTKLAKRLGINMKKLHEYNTHELEMEQSSLSLSVNKKTRWWHNIFKKDHHEERERKQSIVDIGHDNQAEEMNHITPFTRKSTLFNDSMSMDYYFKTVDTRASLDGGSVSSDSDVTIKTTINPPPPQKIPLVQFTKDLMLGIPIVDQQHHSLVDLINKLISLMFGDDENSYRSSEYILGYVLGSLLEYVEYHFETEEKLMKKYAKFLDEEQNNEHKEEHLEFTNKVKKLHQEYLDSHSTLSFLNVDLLNYLLHWLKTHICGTDHEMCNRLLSEVPLSELQ